MNSSKNILIFLNTDYHVETALSIYETLILEQHNPVILLDYKIESGDFGLETFLKKYGIRYLTTKMFDDYVNKDSFNKVFIVTASKNIQTDLKDSAKPPNYNSRMEMFKDKAILIYHRANYYDLWQVANDYFISPKALSATQFSQKFGLDYIYLIENPLSNILKQELNKVIKFLIIGRFNLNNRGFQILESLQEIESQIDKKIQIIFIGQKPEDENKFEKIKNFNLNNTEIIFKFNLDQSELYKEIINSDFILNLIHHEFYFKDRFTSNLNHIIAFQKPNLSPFLLNMIYNIPGLNYKKNFNEMFLKAINMNKFEYEEMIRNFITSKQNMRNHNHFILNNLL
jgi:hypothetical protein